MALIALPTVLAVFVPRLAVEKLSWLLGFGEPPHVTLIYYLAAGGSFIYVVFSILLWLLSNDVERYHPLVVFVAWACLVSCPVYAWMDSQVGMPHWWLLMDSLSGLVGGLALLWALHRETPKN